jgi:hypothetical protein
MLKTKDIPVNQLPSLALLRVSWSLPLDPKIRQEKGIIEAFGKTKSRVKNIFFILVALPVSSSELACLSSLRRP